VRIAATADLHFSASRQSALHDQLSRVRDEADVLVLAGDLTNYGQPDEMEPLLNVVVRSRVPTVAVLGNHDYESGKQVELMRMMSGAGLKVLDGTAYERDGVGFAGTKGFVGGFGRGMLTAFGEPEIKQFVQSSIDEALKLERAAEIFPFMGTTRLAEVVDRHGADLVLHGHAHHGQLEGKTIGGSPVYNVAITLLQAQKPSAVYRVFDI
jgi:Icc-related predicted phosphoesterase